MKESDPDITWAMVDRQTRAKYKLPPEQQAIRDPCFHPSGTFVEFPKKDVETSIPARFEKIVRMYPDRIAVKMSSRVLTYYELNQAANRIAHAILATRGRRSEPIVISFEHSIDVITATLGVLKAGKSYVALDPSLPNERIDHILDDCQPGLLISHQRNIELFQTRMNNGCTLLGIDELDETRSCDDLSLPISPDDLASILYTSGSTGSPKGVSHSHRSQLHTVMSNTNAARISIQDRLSLVHTVGFGSAQAHLFQALLNGASLCSFDLKSEGIHRLFKWLNEEEITIFHSPPGVFRQLAETMADEEKCPHLRLIRLSGASVSRLEFDLYKRKFAPASLLQTVMNSTEANVIGAFITDGEFSFPTCGGPVGYPVPGKTILLLDESGHEVGVGHEGEIAVKSRYLASGYWRMPELTKAKFLPDPNGGDERIYLTGDLGAKLPDGFLIHLGRKDFMVKIRGYRVELGEIERGLLAHPEVKDVALVAWDQERGEKYLVAYVVSRESYALTVNELRGFLKEKLPDYMIPASFMFLEALPLTPNGKVDRKALPEPDDQRPELSTPYVLPRNQVERMLAGMWEEVLGVRPIGINDDFFDLGGDSLKLASLVSRLQRELRMEIAARDVLEAPRISSLGGLIDSKASVAYQAANGQRASQYLVNLRVGSGEKRIFCFPYRGGFRDEYFNFCRISRHFNDGYSFYGLRARGVKGEGGPRGTIKEIAKDFMKAIVSVQPHGPYFLVGECGGGIPAFETARQLQAAGEKVELLILFDTQAWSLKSTIWRRLKEPLNYRNRLGLMPSTWEYFEKRAQLHLIELRRRKGFEQIRYLLDKFIKLPTAVAHSIQQGKPSATGSATEAPAEISRPTVSRLRLSEKDYFIAAHRYRYRAYTGRMALLVNEEWHKAEPSLGWQKFARGGLDIYPIPGDHDHCVPDNIARVAQILKQCLVKAGVA